MAVAPFPTKPPVHSRDDDENRIALTDPEALEEGRMSFLEHLDELRRRLIHCVVALFVGVVIAFFFLDRLFEFVFVPLQQTLPDGGKFITFPLICTKNPVDGRQNMGVYRMHVYGKIKPGCIGRFPKAAAITINRRKRRAKRCLWP